MSHLRRRQPNHQLARHALTALAGVVAWVMPALSWSQVINIGPDLLPPEEAFAIETSFKDGEVNFSVAIADSYYLYRDRTDAKVLAGASQLGELVLPEGKAHVDEFFGEVHTYRGDIAFGAPVSPDAGSSDMLVELVVQGCADVGVCYPPYVTRFAYPGTGGPGTMVATRSPSDFAPLAEPLDNTDATYAALVGGSLPLIILIFFNAGILLSFTPCVLPMVPIVLAVTSGGARPGSRRALALGSTYVAGMAVVYTALGILVASTGGSFLAGSLQNPWVLGSLSALFLVLGSAVFLELNMSLLPAGIARRLEAMRDKPGTFPGALTAGCVSAVVVSPCVAAPLVGALLFIATTGDMVIGGMALFSMALGMGVLPLACAAGAGGMMPKAGPLSEAVRRLFGLMLVALGVWVLGDIVAPHVKMLAYAALGFIGTYVFAKMLWAPGLSRLARSLAGTTSLVLLFLGGVMLVGGVTRGTNELTPLAHLWSDESNQLRFAVVSTEAGYRRIQSTSPAQQGTFEYYYADWCVSCKELEGYTFRDPDIVAALSGYKLLKVDLSANDDDTRRLLKISNLFGPPALVVRDVDGRQLLRYSGYVDSAQLLEGLGKVSGVQTGGSPSAVGQQSPGIAPGIPAGAKTST